MASNKTLSMTYYTDGSTAPSNPGPSGYGWYGFDDLGTIFNGYGAVGTYSTNNIAEMTAFIRVLEYSLTIKTVKSILINTDSRYVLDGFKSLSTDSDEFFSNKDKPNFNVWKDLEVAYLAVKSKAISIKTQWVKGHSNIDGNERADSNAKKGRELIKEGGVIEDAVVIVEQGDAVNEPISPKPVMLTGTRLMFFTNTDRGDPSYSYMSVKFKKDPKDTEVAMRYLGKEHPDTHIGIVVTKEPIELVETVIDTVNSKVTQHMNGGKNIPLAINLPNLFKPVVWRGLSLNKSKGIGYLGGLITSKENLPIGSVLQPPKLTFKLMNTFKVGTDLLEKFKGNDKELITKDITHLLLNTNKNGRQVLNGGIKQGDKLLTVNDVTVGKKNLTIGLDIGLDIPLRNMFSGLLKINKDSKIKVSLLIWDISGRRLSCGTVVECDDSFGIYYAPYAASRLINNTLLPS